MLFRCWRIVAICIALLIASLLPPGSLALANCAADARSAICERKDKGTPQKGDPTSAQAQRALLKSATGRLAKQRKGRTDLYTIGVAGWASQDVFIKELDGALASLAKVLPTSGRVLRLVNQPDTIRTIPLATRSNLAAAVRAVAPIMDKNDDVLILFMTSHGNPGGFGLQLPGKEPIELPPREVAKMLDTAGIRNRLVIVSSCYSGIFVKPLANDNTIVITAADAKNVSFGCEPGRDWTYFGDALFNRSLRPGVDLRRAFNSARLMISEWELMGSLPPSNPQAHFGPALIEKLEPIFAAHAARERDQEVVNRQVPSRAMRGKRSTSQDRYSFMAFVVSPPRS